MNEEFIYLFGIIAMLVVVGFLIMKLGHSLMNIGKSLAVILVVMFILAGMAALGVFG